MALITAAGRSGDGRALAPGSGLISAVSALVGERLLCSRGLTSDSSHGCSLDAGRTTGRWQLPPL